jgi:Na+-driven multidrug efflux pump
VGQNFGAKLWPRVRETFKWTTIDCVAAMILLVAFIQLNAEAAVRIFTSDPTVVAAAVEFLHFTSWNFIPAGIAFSCSSVFQGLGNTWPTFMSSAIRIATFVFPGIWIASQPGFEMRQLYVLSVTTVYIQAGISYFWLRYELKHRITS